MLLRDRSIHGLFWRRCKAANLSGRFSLTALSAAFDPFVWKAEHVSAVCQAQLRDAPLIEAGDFARISPDIDLWDAWPVQDIAGNPAVLGNGDTLWMALAAPHRDDPDERHGLARIHLFQCAGGGWRHLGPLFPEGFTPGSREWSGSAVLADDGRSLTIYFTATGVRGEGALSFGQRLFSARATLQAQGDGYRFEAWRDLTEFVSRDPAWYMASDAGTGSVGTIKAFRDPAYFFDAASGEHWVFFAASLANSAAAMTSRDTHFQMVRPGIALYGGRAVNGRKNPMLPAVTLEAPILMVREARTGEAVGYGATYTLTRDSRIAVIALGYADGLFRGVSGTNHRPGGRAWLRGQIVPIIGKVSMDMFAVDITDLGTDIPRAGEMVEVLGPHVSVDDQADAANTIGYEVLTSLKGRYPRTYVNSADPGL